MILAVSAWDVTLIAFIVIVVNIAVAVVIGRRLGAISSTLESRSAIVVADELGPDDRIVIWHKDEPPVELTPDPETPKPGNPIVGLE